MSRFSVRFIFCSLLTGILYLSATGSVFAANPPPVIGSLIVYSKKVGEFWRLYQVNTGTRTVDPVFSAPDPKLAELNQESPTWSPDGKRVAFLGYKKRPTGSVGALYDQDVYIEQENGAVFPVTAYHYITITSIVWASPSVLLVLSGDAELGTQRIIAIDLSKPKFEQTILWKTPADDSKTNPGSDYLKWIEACGSNSNRFFPRASDASERLSLESIEVGDYKSPTDYDIAVRCSRIMEQVGANFTDPPYTARIVRLSRGKSPLENGLTYTARSLARTYENGNPNPMGEMASQSFAIRKTFGPKEAKTNDDHPYGFFYSTVEGDIAYSHRGEWADGVSYGGTNAAPADVPYLPFKQSSFLYDPAFTVRPSSVPATGGAGGIQSTGDLAYVAGQAQINSATVQPRGTSATGLTYVHKHADNYWNKEAELYKVTLFFNEKGFSIFQDKIALDRGAPIQHPTIRPLVLSKPPAYIPKPGDNPIPVPAPMPQQPGQ